MEQVKGEEGGKEASGTRKEGGDEWNDSLLKRPFMAEQTDRI